MQINKEQTYRKLRRLQLPQIPHTTINNGTLNPQNLHARRHNPTRDSTVLAFRLVNHNNRARLGRILGREVACIVYPVLTGRKAVFLGVF